MVTVELKARLADPLEDALRVIRRRNLGQQRGVLRAVVGVRFFIPPGIVEVDPGDVGAHGTLLVVHSVDKVLRDGKHCLLVLLSVDGEREEPVELRAVGDHSLEAKDVTAALGRVRDHGGSQRL